MECVHGHGQCPLEEWLVREKREVEEREKERDTEISCEGRSINYTRGWREEFERSASLKKGSFFQIKTGYNLLWISSSFICIDDLSTNI